MKHYCFITLLLFTSFCAIAQGKWKQDYHRKSYYDTLQRYRYTIRLSPLSIIDFLQPSVTLGGEWRFKNNSSLGLDISGLIPTNFEDTKKWGFIIKPSYRYYLPGANSAATKFFIEPDIFWKRQLKNEDGWLGKSAVNNNPAFFEFKNYTIIKDVLGANFKIGTQLSSGIKNVMVELYLGAGVRTIRKHIKNEPDAFIRTERGRFFGSSGLFDFRAINETYWGISIPMGMRFVYIFK